jgi:Tol biopolymer transport system component
VFTPFGKSRLNRDFTNPKRYLLIAGKAYQNMSRPFLGKKGEFSMKNQTFKPVLTLILALIFIGCFLPQVHAGPRLINIQQIDYAASPCNSAIPGLSASGQKVAFESDCDWTGNNPFHNTEIFVMEIDGSNPVQVTSGATTERPYIPSCNAALDASGKRLAFLSFADLIPGQNEDGNSDIFRAYADGTGIRQLTNTVGGVDGSGAHCCPGIDYSGRTIVFVSPFDPTNNNEPLGHNELWIVNWDGSGLRRLTNTLEGQNGWPVFDAAGRVYFISHENWNGENPEYWVEIFRIDPKTGEVEQMSHLMSVGGEYLIGKMGVNANGRKIIFPMATGENQPGIPHMELFLLDTKSGEIEQLTQTDSGRGCFMASMSASGKRVAYSCELPDQPQNERVFIADVTY